MAKRKYDWSGLLEDRYFVWTILGIVVVGGGLWVQISLAKILMDVDSNNLNSFLVTHNTALQTTHKK